MVDMYSNRAGIPAHHLATLYPPASMAPWGLKVKVSSLNWPVGVRDVESQFHMAVGVSEKTKVVEDFLN